MDRPCEADREKISDPRRVALESLAGLLRGHYFTVETKQWHLVAWREGSRRVEVSCQARRDDSGRLWFVRAGGIPIVEADNPANAVKAVRQATWRVSA